MLGFLLESLVEAETGSSRVNVVDATPNEAVRARHALDRRAIAGTEKITNCHVSDCLKAPPRPLRDLHSPAWIGWMARRGDEAVGPPASRHPD
ncbi:hypothetical protein [Embleya sp. NPDC001921]